MLWDRRLATAESFQPLFLPLMPPPPPLSLPFPPLHPWPVHGIVSLLRLTCAPLGVCMQSLHPADPGGGASLPSNGCGAPGPEGEWWGSPGCPVRVCLYICVGGIVGMFRCVVCVCNVCECYVTCKAPLMQEGSGLKMISPSVTI